MDDIKEGLKQQEEFLKVWSFERLKSMTLQEYTNLNKEDSFTYWIENKTAKAGGISGGSSFKFGIFKRENVDTKITGHGTKSDGVYSWYSKYGDTKEEVFNNVKKIIIEIANNAIDGNLKAIGPLDLGRTVKWKIAYLYNPQIIIPIFKVKVLQRVAYDNGLREAGDINRIWELQQYLITTKPTDITTLEYSSELWSKYRIDNLKTTLEIFIKQSKTDNLKTKHYPKVYQEYKCKFGFGQGTPARVPWIAFPNPPQRVNKGIYPVYLFYKEKNVLILAYGVSETDKPEINWNLTPQPPTIDKYFEKNYGEKAYRYGSSFVAKVYDQLDNLNEQELEEDLKKVLSDYEVNLESDPKVKESSFKYEGRRYWIYSAGQNADRWEEFYEQRIMAINWDHLGDLREYESQEEIDRKLDPDNPHWNDAKACFEFCNVMQEGDIIISKKGKKNYLGYGVVSSNYIYDEDRPDYKSIRKVDWIKRGEWTENVHDIVTKTLTNISKYPEYVERLINLIGIDTVGHQLKPEPENYNQQDALKSLFLSEEELENILTVLKHKKNIILQGPAGVGKTYIAKKLAYILIGKKDDSKVETIQFHQSYSYEDFIQGYRPTEDGKFDLRDGVFYKFCDKARNDKDNKYFFIIDEINRGNLSKIFGELMMLIEPDKRGPEWGITLTYSESNTDKFYIPENLYLIGTMNTADRSLALVDYALRRRFSFITLTPVFDNKFISFLEKQGVDQKVISQINEKLTKLNTQIAGDKKNLGDGFMIGHSFFCTYEAPEDPNEWYERVIRTEIAPLLFEYWFDDEDTAQKKVDDLLA